MDLRLVIMGKMVDSLVAVVDEQYQEVLVLSMVEMVVMVESALLGVLHI